MLIPNGFFIVSQYSSHSVRSTLYRVQYTGTYTIVVLVHQLCQDVGESVEDGGLDQDPNHRKLRHLVSGQQPLSPVPSLSLLISLVYGVQS